MNLHDDHETPDLQGTPPSGTAYKDEWTPYFKMTYQYGNDEITMSYARWNETHKAYDKDMKKSVYEMNDENMPVAYKLYNQDAPKSELTLVSYNQDRLRSEHSGHGRIKFKVYNMKSTSREARAFILYTGVIILMSSRLFLSRQPATSSPFSVAELDSVIFTITKSPTRCVPRSNTTTRFCSVRPKNWSRDVWKHLPPAPRTFCPRNGRWPRQRDGFVRR